jgi:hypothetical protein
MTSAILMLRDALASLLPVAEPSGGERVDFRGEQAIDTQQNTAQVECALNKLVIVIQRFHH